MRIICHCMTFLCSRRIFIAYNDKMCLRLFYAFHMVLSMCKSNRPAIASLYKSYVILQGIFYLLLLDTDIFLSNCCAGMLQELAHKLDIVSVIDVYLRCKVLSKAVSRYSIKSKVFASCF